MKIQELDNDLRTCKDEFKEFERQDVKYREDSKHIKQKIKKLEEKLEKVKQAYGDLILLTHLSLYQSRFLPLESLNFMNWKLLA